MVAVTISHIWEILPFYHFDAGRMEEATMDNLDWITFFYTTTIGRLILLGAVVWGIAQGISERRKREKIKKDEKTHDDS